MHSACASLELTLAAVMGSLTGRHRSLLLHILEATDQGVHYSVREFAARNYVSPAAVVRLSKKMGYTGYTDMIYRLEFLIQNEINNKNLSSEITSFIGEIPQEHITQFTRLLAVHRRDTILVCGTGFCSPLRDFFVRKLLVLGFTAIATNNYEVYENNPLQAGLVIAISKSGTTGTIVKPVQDVQEHGVDLVAFTGNAASPIARHARPAFLLLDDKMLDDRNLTANYFYARVQILFEYLLDISVNGSGPPDS